MRHANEPDSHERARKQGSGHVYHIGKKGVSSGGNTTFPSTTADSDRAFADMSIYEYLLLISVEEQKATKAATDQGGAVRGAAPGARFEFHEKYELRDSWIQAARSKIPCPRIAGRMPPKPPPRAPGSQASEAWMKAMRQFAAFVVAVFVPWVSACSHDGR
eukprot:5990291-Prymnesium_polylepis.2